MYNQLNKLYYFYGHRDAKWLLLRKIIKIYKKSLSQAKPKNQVDFLKSLKFLPFQIYQDPNPANHYHEYKLEDCKIRIFSTFPFDRCLLLKLPFPTFAKN